jgi:protein MAK16
MIVLILFLQAIETELMERLKKGIYPTEIYNLSDSVFNKLLDREIETNDEVEKEEEEEGVIEYVEGDDELEAEEEEDMEDFSGLPSKESYLEGDDHDSDDEDDDDAEEQVVIHKKGRALKKSDDNGKAKKKPRVVVEVEQEDADTRRSLKSLKI